MHEQPSLFNEQTESRFQAFLKAHPEIYQAYCRLALQKIQAGAKRIGSKAIWEVLRWQSSVGDDEGKYRFDNRYTPYFARQFVRDYPEYSTVFEFRRSKADAEV